MWIEPINIDAFLGQLGPALQTANADLVAQTILRHWQPGQLCQLLQHEQVEVRRVGCVALGLVGGVQQLRCLCEALRDEDEQVNRLAEHAMWTIWFRGGSQRAQRHFKRGLQAIERGQPQQAIAWFDDALAADSQFAEAYNQRALACYQLERWHEALADAQEAVERMPVHFGAWACMGHVYAQLDDLNRAAECYRKALKINPNMHGVADALRCINRSHARAQVI